MIVIRRPSRIFGSRKAAPGALPCASQLLYRRYYETDMNSDVVVVGGGTVGSALACALGRILPTSYCVSLIDESPTLEPLESIKPFSNRLFSITPASARFLQAIGAWSHLEKSRIKQYTSMQVWDAAGSGFVRFDASSDSSPIAWVIENLNLQHALQKAIAELGPERVRVFSPASVQSIRKGTGIDSWPQVCIRDGPVLTTRLLIGADGTRSSVRQFANIDTIAIDYDQRGIVATLRVDAVENTSAWQRFLPTGPVALLPLDEYHCSLVWSISTDLAKRISLLPDEAFVALLNTALLNPPQDVQFLCSQISAEGTTNVDFSHESAWGRKRVPHIGPVPPLVVNVLDKSRAAFPLRLSHASRYVAPRIALIGDAAHTIHPLAGQGLNLGLADVEVLSNVLQNGVESGQDIGSVILLEEYAKQRYTSNVMMQTGVHAIQRLFGTDSIVIGGLRSFGLNVVNSFGSLKNLLMKLAGA
ncbi:hypothetical protein SmJEL517_g02929 [Synchytrium microbalum]|uniref:Ubiquinone biosynthesis monooxygenase COQ6, mitochondrial n=1 Tax=Synchytrium microbalum TaxID=1806994 RepID=A0A507BYE0_9FUNG|nr:uncharacterized protein SmJEL517_g02929 [Synchytrium microbalum]TPX34330.1 hypothetical protein SmJEL517_g02929 [Synchytrium microbalum]